ncbi:MAG: hypothetical protein V4808_13355 [Pseudomonadota bacterium]
MSDWAQLFLVVVGLFTLIAFVAAFKRSFPEPANRNAEFARILIKAVKHHTEQLEREFKTALRVPGIDTDSGKSGLGATEAAAHVRHLRRLLRGSTSFIQHTRTMPLGDWPNYALSHAFAEWAGLIDGTDTLLDDMYREVTAAVATGRWAELQVQYDREQWFVLRDLEKLPALTKAVEKAAKPFLKKSEKHEESDEAHH